MTSIQRDPSNPGVPLIPSKDWDYPPYHRWTFQHVREMTATENIRRSAAVMPLSERRRDISAVEFASSGEHQTIDHWLKNAGTDGFLLLFDGHIIDERYFNGLQPWQPHLAMSVSKSITATVFGILAGRGLIAPQGKVADYLPELAATAWNGARVQHVLDMTSGVLFDEPYSTNCAHMQKLGQACGWFEVIDKSWPMSVWQLILQLTEQECPHGTRFCYRSIETDVLAFIMQRVTGKSLAQLIETQLWQPMGAAEDAYITVDRAGYGLADGGFNATLRDFARFALLLLRGGKNHQGRQIVPKAWIDEIGKANHEMFTYRAELPRGAYHNQFWIEEPDSSVFMCFGIFGQYIYIDPAHDFAFVQLSTAPEPVSERRTADMLAAAHALKRFCLAQS